MTAAKIERAVTESPEAERLKADIFKAMMAYVDFLRVDRNLIWDDNDCDCDGCPRLNASALVASFDFDRDVLEIYLKDGALDRMYGDGVNPDPLEPESKH
jgi:hypothetical protein